MALILDTGPLYASLDRSDQDHAASRELIEHSDETLVIPTPVLVEVDYLISTHLHPGVMVALLDDIIAGAYRVEDLQPRDYERVQTLIDRYDDSDIGFVLNRMSQSPSQPLGPPQGPPAEPGSSPAQASSCPGGCAEEGEGGYLLL